MHIDVVMLVLMILHALCHASVPPFKANVSICEEKKSEEDQ